MVTLVDASTKRVFAEFALTCWPCCVLCWLSCSAVLIGEPGVGKTSIIHGLAQRLVAGDVPDSIRGAKLIGLELGLLMAGGRLTHV